MADHAKPDVEAFQKVRACTGNRNDAALCECHKCTES